MKKVKAAGTPRIATRVRSAVAAEDLSGAERLMRIYRDEHGNTPEALEALSWLARGLFAARRFDKAAEYAREAHRLTVRRLDASELQSEPSLASALGASIEVLAQWKDLKERRSDAVRFLKRELAKFGLTPVGTRIRKNLNLLTLEGQPAPELQIVEWLGPKPPVFSKLRGQPVLLFFWAHYCEDSRAQGRVLMRIRDQFDEDRVGLIAPTRRYGYLDEHRNRPASQRQETAHIRTVLNRHYASLLPLPVPISERNFDLYGVSTTPTLVLIDPDGIVLLYHPGKMPFRELASQIRRALA